MRNLLRCTVIALFLAVALTHHAAAQAVESTVVAFTGTTGANPGLIPSHAMIQASDGNFYGTTNNGGSANAGTVFKLTPSGKYTVLHNFGGSGDGQYPEGGVIQGFDGSLYGTTYEGGGNSVGTLYTITLAGNESVLHNFAGGPDDGSYPQNGAIQGPDGSFYGTTYIGGGTQGQNDYTGTVYKLNPAGSFSLLHRFSDAVVNQKPQDGSAPAGLILGTDGNLYGTTTDGGPNKYGTVFTITPGGDNYTILHSFDGGSTGANPTDGSSPSGALIEGPDGNYYGLTYQGGDEIDYGIAYRITAAGAVKSLHSFGDQDNNGNSPVGSLLLGSDGNFYGATQGGGQWALGTAFEMSPAGDLNVLFPFAQDTETSGDTPLAGVAQGSDGNLYGTTSEDGPSADGTIYKLAFSSALSAPVQLTGPSSVAAGASFSLAYNVLNAYKGAQAGTMNECFASNSAGDTTGWSGILTGEPTMQSKTVTASTTPGTYTYALTCGGIESGFATLTVTTSGMNPTTTTLPNDPFPATIGQPVTIVAMVAHSSGTATPTGTVTFYFHGTALGTKPLAANGTSSLTASTATLPPGTYQVTASYSGDANYLASSSGPETVILSKAPTATTVTASPNPVTSPAKCTLKATVKRTASGATGFATGSVTFLVGTTVVGSAALNASGVATLSASTSGIAAGKYPVTAKYTSDASDVASSSPAVTVTVQ